MYYVSQLCFGHHCLYFFLEILKLETIIFLIFFYFFNSGNSSFQN